MSVKEFTYPDIYAFPPFFTKQPNPDTWHKQRQLWKDIVLEYCRFYRVFVLDVNEVVRGGGLFVNKRIQRSLSMECIQSILDDLVKQGNAKWETTTSSTSTSPTSPPKTRIQIIWRKPEEWANLVYDFISTHGMQGSICTVYELLQGDLTEGTEFYGMDRGVFLEAMQVLSKSGKAQLFSATDPNEMGVKFA